MNSYLDIHENPAILNGGSILIWCGENVDVEEPTESLAGEENSTEGEGTDDESGVV